MLLPTPSLYVRWCPHIVRRRYQSGLLTIEIVPRLERENCRPATVLPCVWLRWPQLSVCRTRLVKRSCTLAWIPYADWAEWSTAEWLTVVDYHLTTWSAVALSVQARGHEHI
jgi:hypothetical protein